MTTPRPPAPSSEEGCMSFLKAFLEFVLNALFAVGVLGIALFVLAVATRSWP